MAEKAITYAIEALQKDNPTLLQEVLAFDREIDAKESEIESLCLKLILKQQPVAKDLRMISAALKMITDLERIGDQCADIVEIASQAPKKALATDHITEMAKATMAMVSKSIESCVQHDTELAHEVIDSDDWVDELFLEVQKDVIMSLQSCCVAEVAGADRSVASGRVIQSMDSAKQQTPPDAAIIDMLMVAKYFERIGDHAVNVAEWSLFAITGEHKNQQLM